MLDLRLPRAVLGVLVGAALGLSGAVLQAWLRNPLAEPGVIGVSACASFAAVCAFYSGLAAAFALALPLAGILGAAVGIAALMSAVRAGTGTVSLLLMGVAINAIAAALISLVLALAPNPFAFQEIWLWLAGSIADRDLRHILVSAPFIVVGAGLVLMNRRWLDALSLGEDAARSLGVDTRRLGLWLTLAVGLMVGAATAVAGMIGFVGLVAPHLIRAQGRLQARRHPGAVDAGRRDPGSRGRHRRARAADLLRVAARRRHLAGRRAVPRPRDPSRTRLVARDMTMLATRSLVRRRGERTVLDGIEIAFAGGQLSAIVGPNGAGKTTLLRLLAGLDSPTAARRCSTAAGSPAQCGRAVPAHRVSAAERCRLLAPAGTRSRRAGPLAARSRSQPAALADRHRCHRTGPGPGRTARRWRRAGSTSCRKANAPGSRSPASWRPRPMSSSRTNRSRTSIRPTPWKP